MLKKLLDRSLNKFHGAGGFGIEIMFPGLTLGGDDSGIGAIGRIDRARIRPGTAISMHPHRDDEILTYLRAGTMQHRDTLGHKEEVSATRLMLMNAGSTFQHEEEMIGTETIEALQIFLRPAQPGLEPKVQFHLLKEKFHHGSWRLLAGPGGDAPLEVRANVWVEDTTLTAGDQIALPASPVLSVTRMLYVFSGQVRCDNQLLKEGDGLLLNGLLDKLSAVTGSELILFTTDMKSPYYSHGMFSGNVLSHSKD